MLIQERRRPAWQGILLIAGFAASLWCARADAHEVPHHHTEAHETTDTETEHGEAEVRGIRQLVRDFRRTGDDRYLDEAWKILGEDSANMSPETLVDAATVAQARHEFDTALALIDRALVVAPHYDQAWLLRASIQLVRGELDDASDACRRLRHSPLLVAVTCSARVSIARGDSAPALRRLTAVLAATDATTEWYAWALSVAGDAATPIDGDRAIAYYEQSLTLMESAQVRAALVDVLLDANRLQDAQHTLAGASHALALDVRRMIVARQLGDDGLAQQIAAADHEFRHWIADEDWLHAREMARFYLDVLEQPELARRIAAINLTLQREREDLRLAARTGVVTACTSC